MPLATLSIELEAKLAKLEANLDRSARIVEQGSGRMAEALGAARAAAGALSSVLALGAVTAFARNVINGVDALNDFADAVGTSVENASALEDAAARTGTSLETVEAAALKLNKTLSDAKPGSDQAKVLQSIGLSAEELRRIDPAEALLQVANALAKYEDGGNKARLVQELFGKSAKEVAPFLKDLAEKGRLNATVTREQAEQAEKFNKQLAELQKNSLDWARTLAGPLVQSINETIQKFKEGSAAGKGFFETLREEQLKLLGIGGQDPLVSLQRDLAAIEKALQRADLTAERRAELEAKRQGRLASIAKLQGEGAASFRPSQNYGDMYRPDAPDLPSAGAVGDKAKYFVSNSFDPALSNALRALEQTDTSKIRELQGQLSALFDLQRETRGDPAVAEAIRRTREELEKLQAPAIGPGILDTQERIKSEFLRSEKAGYEDTDKLLREQQLRVQKTKGLAEDLGATFASAFEDALISGQKFSDLLKGLEQDILRLVTRKLITEPLAGGITGFLQGLTGGTGQGGGYDFGKLAGDWIKGLFAGPFADGGFIPPGQWGWVGERGPEPAYGGRTGLTVRPAGSGGVVQNINFMLSGPVDQRTQSQIAALTARAVGRASYRNN